ncbi:MAG: hypothetical protein V4451_20055 [Pseudomonadota bacterium]
MKLLSGKRNQRNTAFVVLMLWTFAMASSAANACLLEAHDTHVHVHMVDAAKAAPALDSHHEHEHEHEHAPIDGDHAAADGSKVPCQKFCSEESEIITKQHFGLDQPDPGQVPLVVVLWVVPELSGQTPVRMDSMRPLPLPLPLRVRYSRMAL